MSIYLWKNPEIQNKYMCAYDYERSPDRFQFNDGRYLKDENIEGNPVFSVRVSKKQLQQFDCLSNNANCPLVNEYVAAMLKEMVPDDIEFFETKIVCTDGVFLNYKLINITHAIECIDLEKSIYDKMENIDAIAGYRKPIYKPDCMGHHLFARDKDLTSQILVGQAIYDRFRRERIKGARLITPHDLYKELYPRYYLDE